MGDAKSLQGGTLMQSPLKAANGKVYAVAQGAVLVEGCKGGVEEIIDININQTISRSVMTSVTTLMVLVTLLIIGSPAYHPSSS